MKDPDFNKIQELFINDEIEQISQIFCELTDQKPIIPAHIKNEAIHLRGWLEDINRQKRLSIASIEENEISRNKIRFSFIEFSAILKSYFNKSDDGKEKDLKAIYFNAEQYREEVFEILSLISSYIETDNEKEVQKTQEINKLLSLEKSDINLEKINKILGTRSIEIVDQCKALKVELEAFKNSYIQMYDAYNLLISRNNELEYFEQKEVEIYISALIKMKDSFSSLKNLFEHQIKILMQTVKNANLPAFKRALKMKINTLKLLKKYLNEFLMMTQTIEKNFK